MELSATEKVTEKEAAKVCSQLAGKFGNDRQSDLLGKLQAEYHKNRGYLLEYQMTLKTLFQDLDEQTSFLEMSMKRIDVSAKYHGTVVKFKDCSLFWKKMKEYRASCSTIKIKNFLK